MYTRDPSSTQREEVCADAVRKNPTCFMCFEAVGKMSYFLHFLPDPLKRCMSK